MSLLLFIFSIHLILLEPQDYIFRREFAFIFEDDAYLRYQSFKNEHEFRTQLSKSQPFKIDIGAVFNHEVRL